MFGLLDPLRAAQFSLNYVQSAQEKIQLYKAKLATAKMDGVPVKERQKWRNVVSAQ